MLLFTFILYKLMLYILSGFFSFNILYEKPFKTHHITRYKNA